MLTTKVKALSKDAFAPYGDYTQLIRPAELFAGMPVNFTPDMVQLNLNRFTIASFSICRVEKRDLVVTASEYHSYTGEGIIPLEDDIIIHVGKPFRRELIASEIEAFRVPKGYMVCLKPGVLHMAPFAVDQTVNAIIVLPERTYANDCVVIRHEEKDHIRIEL
ncbi:MAG: DUF4867 family protein [Christensenellaceae bacterium]|jgi:ureidoglycolate lyase|nr:DUF4867 family protein [Christensenellaceae bacterium]